MNKAELKKFAVEARRDLIDKVSLKAEQYGITKDNQEVNIEENYGQLIVNGKTFPIEMKHAVHTLQQRLNQVGYDQLIEEVAYTWFNRIIAIRYMEVNNYLPDRVNVLSSSTGKNEPDILLQYETMNLDVDREQINEWLQKGDNEQAYRTLFIAQCNALNQLLPFLFEKIEDYTELLLPDYLLDQESIIRKMVNNLSDENFYQIQEDGSRKDNVEVLGWLYQYYMSEKKEQVGGLRNNAVKKEDLPVVTQLFTPKWIVQYMVQNSLGKLYDEKYQNNHLAQHWEYYLKHEENHHLYPEFDSLEELKIMDPACGSGHILLYAFDMLYDIYEEAGYLPREIPQLILEKNLYGLDIDKRAQQIANFALLMKAAEKQPRFISRLSRKGKSPNLNVYEIVDTDETLSEEAINYFTDDGTEKSLINELLNQFENGKQFGSLINPIEIPYEKLIDRIYDLVNKKNDLIDESYFNELKDKLLPVLEQALLLYQKYDVVVTNPPYHNKYNPLLKKFMNKEYKDYKSDLYSAFIYKTSQMAKENGYSALMTPYTWMFISSHERLRNYILSNHSIASLVQMEYSSFKEATVPICSFVIQNQHLHSKGEYLTLREFKGELIQPIKVKEAVKSKDVKYRYNFDCNEFQYIPSTPITFWLNKKIADLYKEVELLKDHTISDGQIITGNNDKYLRFIWEVPYDNINDKWTIHLKGGSSRKWFGNVEHVIDWSPEALNHYKKDKIARLIPKYLWFKEGISWTMISSTSNKTFRYVEEGYTSNKAAPTIFFNSSSDLFYILGFLNTKVANDILGILNNTLNLNVFDIRNLPYIDADSEQKNRVIRLVKKAIEVSKEEWNSYETSIDFSKHPFLINENQNLNKINDAFEKWEKGLDEKVQNLLEYEIQLNEIFTSIYNLENDLNITLTEDDITLRKADRTREAKSFLSYFIGCLMGRYSLDVEGIAYAGGKFDDSKYESFKPNPEGLIQLTDDHYFDNDIILRLRGFLSVAFSPETVDENMRWLADSLNMKKNESSEERLRRYFLDEFFKDHCKTYQKRPIYWLVESGKQKGLRTLIYMHRYQPDTMATIRFEHLQEIQSKYQNEINMIDTRLANPSLSATDRRSLEKAKTDYQKKLDELQEFDKHLATYANEQIDIDLDDGVKVNYAKFDKVLSKIK
ncbi:BREX-1 system adenine-specific DNA-methyltransferase PglX [Tenuibacillus multivorans]|uniref:site-specific DNA-methyltransferase (adenine-specific) n=1 Tax=Tenuibacillus multivorans TaxID=237069 RepID=A0A1G9YJ59_9BACI|nr:BREX-1 system adenine-specific DNA-methyltransferase PglX [Tenuibacillus multivorans]GEL78690.1 class I SAM-dependent DNA methyltransferase [Tenuibacillus multivorans]SDN09050.1 Eco57I restriction-modification methylase [Tenuibacillus multivorans]